MSDGPQIPAVPAGMFGALVMADLDKENARLRRECERLRAENERLRQRIAAPIDVEAFRPEFEKLLGIGGVRNRRSDGDYFAFHANWAWRAATAFADRLNAARKEVGE